MVILVMRGNAMLGRKRPAVAMLLVVLLLALGTSTAEAQFLCDSRVDRTSVVAGSGISLFVSAEGSVSGSVDFQLPDMPSVLVTGTSYSRSQSIINGRSSVTIGKVFYLEMQTVGKVEIGPVVVSDGKSSCETKPITITVTARASIPPSVSGNRVPRPAGSTQKTVQKEPSAGGKPGDDIFITLESDHSTAWVGQQIILTFRYYYRHNPWNQPQLKEPRTPGFWRETLVPQLESRTTVGGRSYSFTEIKYAIFPTHAGDLTVEPAELSFPDQGLDRFFTSRRRQGPRTLRTDALEIKVKSLPAGKPEGFSGLVASQVRLTAQSNRDSVPRGEPVDFQVRLVSDAFLKGFDGLKIPEMEGLRIHDAGSDLNTKIEHRRLVGQFTLEKVIVPQEEGLVNMPPVSLSWFDTRRGEYRTTNAALRPVMVMPSDNPYAEQEDSGFLRSEVSRLGQDLVFIHNVPGSLNMGRKVIVHSFLWWAGMILPVLLLGVLRFLRGRRQSDPVFLRRQNALRQAIQVMDGSGHTSALDRLARCITGFVADCSNRPLASVDGAVVRDFCVQLGCSDDGKELMDILESCDMARFGGNHSGQEEEQVSSRVKSILEKLHKLKMKNTPDGSAGSVATIVSFLVLAAFVSTGAEAADPARLMAEANQAYTEGQVDVAMDLYKQAEALGVQDADLFFNIGNAHARQGELGFAVVNYLRAKQLAPRDQDIRDNLAWVRGSITDLELAEGKLPLFIAQFVAVVFALTLGQWAIFLLVMVWAGCGLVAYQWIRDDFSDNLRRLMLLFAAVVLILAVIVFWRWSIEEVRQTAVVVVEEVAVRSGPDDSFGVPFMVHDGLTIRLEEERENWVRISLGGESLGWMPLTSIERVRREY